MANENNFPQGGMPAPAPFPSGVPQGGQPQSGQPISPQMPGITNPMPSPLPPMGGPSIPPPQPVGPSVPPPPPPEVGIRTMASDMKSMQSSGGAGATPKTFKPEDFSSEPVFRPSGFAGKPSSPTPGAPGVKVVSPNHARKSLLITIGILVFLALAGAVVYFVIMPMLSAKPAPVVAPPVVQTPVTPPPAVTLTTHQSFFTPAVTPSGQVTLDLSMLLIQSALVQASSDVQTAGTFKDVNFSLNGKPWTAQDFLGFALPGQTKDFFSNAFEKDFTGFVYYDKNGAWPGYVFKLKSGVDANSTKTVLNPLIEASPAVFFQSNPGTAAKTGFADGATPDGKTVRFITFSKKGAALEYSWFGNYLTVSTSYQGLLEAIKRLGS